MTDLKKYKIVQLQEKNLPKGKTDTIIKLYRKDKKMMNLNEARDILDEFKKKNKKNNVQFMIRARNKIDISTLKGFEERNIPEDYDEDYFGNRGYNPDDFGQIFYLEITLRK